MTDLHVALAGVVLDLALGGLAVIAVRVIWHVLDRVAQP